MHIWFKNQFTESKQITYLYLEHEVNRMREEKLSFLVLYFVLSGIIIVHLDTFFFFFFDCPHDIVEVLRPGQELNPKPQYWQH